jgi:NAD(P)-dependent dehydrogenase (short-subunit alcohol dehydrogenase family)
MKPLRDKTALVTGSTSGIGRGVAVHLATLGARLVVSGRDEKRGADTVARIREAGGEAAFYKIDLREEKACCALIAFAVQEFGSLDLLVNNAADTSRGNIESTPTEDFDRLIGINLRAPFVLIRESIPHMKKQGGGCIINIGSVNAYIGEPKLCAYSVSKGGLMTLTKNAASHLNQYKIRVNQLNVGWTHTEGEDRVKRLEGKGDEWLEEALATRPFGRLLQPLDIAYACEYFATARGECITGAVVDLEQYPVGAPPNW